MRTCILPTKEPPLKVKVTLKVKQTGGENVYQHAGGIVRSTMDQLTSETDVALPNPGNLVRVVNRHRQKMRPKEPRDLDFEFDEDYVGDDFLVDDVRVDTARHLIFATAKQLDQLRLAKRWFIDGTFKIVKQPFYQLTTLHAFVRKGGDAKQVPLVYVLMLRRSTADYGAVLTSIKAKLGDPLVEWFMLDFESAAWRAIREVFLGCILKGCSFHWGQRIHRRIQQEGLATAYRASTSFCGKLCPSPTSRPSRSEWQRQDSTTRRRR